MGVDALEQIVGQLLNFGHLLTGDLPPELVLCLRSVLSGSPSLCGGKSHPGIGFYLILQNAFGNGVHVAKPALSSGVVLLGSRLDMGAPGHIKMNPVEFIGGGNRCARYGLDLPFGRVITWARID